MILTPSKQWGVCDEQFFHHNSNVTMLQQNFAYAALSCYVQNFVAITVLVFGWEQNEIPITF